MNNFYEYLEQLIPANTFNELKEKYDKALDIIIEIQRENTILKEHIALLKELISLYEKGEEK